MGSWMALKSEPPLDSKDPYPLFNRVSIETVGRCTRECEFCPSRFRTNEQRGVMDHATYAIIMKQLHDLKFKGVMQLFYLGEPLLDQSIVERVALARRCCPKATLLLTSNGDLLKRVEQIDELYDAGLNVLNIDAYEPDIYDRIEDIVAECHEDIDVSYGKVRWKTGRGKYLHLVNVSEPTVDRHAACHTYLHPEIEKVLSEKDMLTKKGKWCAQPHRRLVVWWTGDVALCCTVTPTIPDAPIVGSYKDLLGAWNSPIMRQYRWQLQQGLKQGVCERCYYRHAFPHVVRRITKPENVR